MSEKGRCCRKSRKSNDAENLAYVDFYYATAMLLSVDTKVRGRFSEKRCIDRSTTPEQAPVLAFLLALLVWSGLLVIEGWRRGPIGYPQSKACSRTNSSRGPPTYSGQLRFPQYKQTKNCFLPYGSLMRAWRL